MHRKSAALNKLGGLGLEKSLAFGLLAAVVFFVISAAVAVYTTQTLRTSNESVVKTHQVIVSIDLLLSDVQDAETGQRGYLLRLYAGSTEFSYHWFP